jgi:hypothetical protein
MLILREQNAQERIEGRQPLGWADDDFAVVDDVVIGRIYKERTPGGEWLWFLQILGAPPPTQGITQTLDEAKTAIAQAYKRYARPQDPHLNGSGLRFETLEHGGEYPDTMPQAIRVTDKAGRSSVYVPMKDVR